jgi:hypothetical protein
MFVKAVAMVFASKIQGRSRYGTIFAILLLVTTVSTLCTYDTSYTQQRLTRLTTSTSTTGMAVVDQTQNH